MRPVSVFIHQPGFGGFVRPAALTLRPASTPFPRLVAQSLLQPQPLLPRCLDVSSLGRLLLSMQRPIGLQRNTLNEWPLGQLLTPRFAMLAALQHGVNDTPAPASRTQTVTRPSVQRLKTRVATYRPAYRPAEFRPRADVAPTPQPPKPVVVPAQAYSPAPLTPAAKQGVAAQPLMAEAVTVDIAPAQAPQDDHWNQDYLDLLKDMNVPATTHPVPAQPAQSAQPATASADWMKVYDDYYRDAPSGS